MLCVGIYAFVFCTYRLVVTHVKQFVIKQRSAPLDELNLRCQVYL